MGSVVKGVTSAFFPGAGQYFGAQEQAQATRDAAGAQVEAARIAAEEARFRPVGITSRFGSSNFQFDERGRLVGAGYTPSEQISGLQGRLDQLTNQYLDQATRTQPVTEQLAAQGNRMFALGQQALPSSYDPTAAARDYLQQQQALLAPSRERELAALQNRVYQTGREGLRVGGTQQGYMFGGQGLAASQPEYEALYNARAAQDAALASQATQQARANLIQDIGVGQQLTQGGLGMFSAIPQFQVQSLSPFQTTFGTQQQLEAAAMQPLDVGAQLGGRTATAGAQAGQSLLLGGINAGRTMASAPSATGALFQGLGQMGQQTGLQNQTQNWLRGLFSPTPYGDRGTVWSNTPGTYGEFDY